MIRLVNQQKWAKPQMALRALHATCGGPGRARQRAAIAPEVC